MRYGSIIAAAAGALMLAGCANWDVDGTAAMPDQGDAFAKALHKEYIDRARFEVHEEDWISVDFFTGRAKLAAMGQPPAPQSPSERSLKVEAAEINAGYAKLTGELNAGAAKVTPVACAKAQAWFEHWMEQAEEGHQANDIAWTRGEFMKAMPNCYAKKVAAPAPAPAPAAVVAPTETFAVYFPFASSKLTPEANKTIKAAVAAIKKGKVAELTVTGHTDTMGKSDLNMKLGQKRADAVAKALKAHGVKSKIKAVSFGESNLPVPTADQVKEQKNRVATIVFAK